MGLLAAAGPPLSWSSRSLLPCFSFIDERPCVRRRRCFHLYVASADVCQIRDGVPRRQILVAHCGLSCCPNDGEVHTIIRYGIGHTLWQEDPDRPILQPATAEFFDILRGCQIDSERIG